jgi:lysophospholipase L1-like esterase
MIKMFQNGLMVAFVALVSIAPVLAESPPVRVPTCVLPNSKVAIVGDSITEQKLYSKYMEAYLLACSGVPNLSVMQFGWSGEQAGGFAARAENDLGVFMPNVVTLCYGMNDGGYQPYREEIGANYEKNMRNVQAKLEALKVNTIVFGSPGAVDTNFFRSGQMMGERTAHEAYNDNLAHLRDIDRKLATESKQRFADVHAAMFDAMGKAKEKLGKDYDVCGRDGFHPGPNGQLLMAYAFLKSLDLDGQIGEINVQLNGTSTATPGHKVLSSEKGKVELESTRWPFCFEGDDKSSNGTRSITPFVSFNQDLNRYVLKVQGLTTAKAKVTWGEETKEFSREQLTAGINLAAEFSKTPFDGPFQQFQNAVGNKQNFETYMIKQVVTNFRSLPRELNDDIELQAALKVFKSRLMARQQQLDAEAKALLVPVKHTIVVTAVE